jgi:hypothetical protein
MTTSTTTPTKHGIRVGPIWVAALMGLWALALIVPALMAG